MDQGLPNSSIIIVNLVNPKEKFWGVLLATTQVGVTLRGINLESFEDWVNQLARRDDEPTLGLVTMFVPMLRVERIYIDEPVGSIPSYSDHFANRVGQAPRSFLGIIA